MLHERANNERFREATVVQVGLLIADILSRMKRERERERKIEKFFSLECTIALTANCLLSCPLGEETEIFVASSDFLVGRKTRSARICSRRTGQKGPWNPWGPVSPTFPQESSYYI